MKSTLKKQKKYMWVFVNGKQVKMKRPETIDDMEMEEFIRNNGDSIWLHQNEMWECIKTNEDDEFEWPF